jgi:hypothetical protein
MKIEINYRYRTADKEHPCQAQTVIGDRSFIGLGQTWEKARADLIEDVKRSLSFPTVPQTEKVEV